VGFASFTLCSAGTTKQRKLGSEQKIAKYIREHFEANLDGSALSFADVANYEFQEQISASRYEVIVTCRETIASDDKAHWGGYLRIYAFCKE